MKKGEFHKWLCVVAIMLFATSAFSQENLHVTSKANPDAELVTKSALSISKYLKFHEEYSTFVKVLRDSEMLSFLESGSGFTVFAPANAAFSQMPNTVLNQIFQPENDHKLLAISGYHIVNSVLNLEEELYKLNGVTNIVAINNEIIEVSIGPEEALEIRDANGYPIDVMQKIILSDGVIYRIDAVLLPQVDVKMVAR